MLSAAIANARRQARQVHAAIGMYPHRIRLGTADAGILSPCQVNDEGVDRDEEIANAAYGGQRGTGRIYVGVTFTDTHLTEMAAIAAPITVETLLNPTDRQGDEIPDAEQFFVQFSGETNWEPLAVSEVGKRHHGDRLFVRFRRMRGGV